jgi:hypothetical protein
MDLIFLAHAWRQNVFRWEGGCVIGIEKQFWWNLRLTAQVWSIQRRCRILNLYYELTISINIWSLLVICQRVISPNRSMASKTVDLHEWLIAACSAMSAYVRIWNNCCTLKAGNPFTGTNLSAAYSMFFFNKTHLYYLDKNHTQTRTKETPKK